MRGIGRTIRRLLLGIGFSELADGRVSWAVWLVAGLVAEGSKGGVQRFLQRIWQAFYVGGFESHGGTVLARMRAV